MTRVLHLFNAQAGWEERIGATQLMDRLPAGRFECHTAATDGKTRGSIFRDGRDVDLLPLRLGGGVFGAAAIRRYVDDHRIDLVHAWGQQAAVAASSAANAIVVEQFDPNVSNRRAKMLRTVTQSRRLAVACSSETVRRRLIEQGVPVAACPVIRPGVDLAAINAARNSGLRGQLGLADDDMVIITPEPATRRGGQFIAYWAAAVRSFLDPKVRLILSGISAEQARIRRLAEQLQLADFVRFPGRAFAFEDLVAVADVMIAAPETDASSTAIAWAMAAGVPVLAVPTRSVTELITNGQNGVLAQKLGQPKHVAIELAGLLDDREALARTTQAARAQAFDLFSVQRYVDQHAQLYESLRA